MPLDHYVSQVHLRNFSSPALGGMLNGIRKSDLSRFRAWPQDVCRIRDNSTNTYLVEDRAIEEFLKNVEPRYNSSIAKLRKNTIDQECIYCIAGFIAYVATCSPTAMRIHSRPPESAVETTAAILDARGALPKAPEVLGGKSITELLQDGSVKVTVNPKYTQAVGIGAILNLISVFGNSYWEILHNREQENPFFTSDYPATIEAIRPNSAVNHVVPLTRDLAIRIIPDIHLSRTESDLSFAKIKSISRLLKHAEIRDINQLIVRCAEDLVLYSDDHYWIEGFVKKNRMYRIEAETIKIPSGNGFYNVSTQRITQRSDF